MIRQIKQLWYWLRMKPMPTTSLDEALATDIPETFTREQIEKAFRLGYTEGRRDGLAIARKQATNSLKEILWHQNNPKK